MRKRIKSIIIRMTEIKCSSYMAFATAMGVLLGMLPLSGIRVLSAFFLSALFSLNVFSMFIGLFITILIPALHAFTAALVQKLGNYPIPFFTNRYLSLKSLVNFTKIEQLSLISSIISGLILGAVFFVIFNFIYKFLFSKKKNTISREFVFSDKNGKRWPLLKICTFVILSITVTVFMMTIASISENPILPNLRLEFVKQLNEINPLKENIKIDTITKQLKNFYGIKHKNHLKHYPNNDSNKVFAFYVSWDENSLKSLQQNINSIGCVIPDWFVLNQSCQVTSTEDRNVDSMIKQHSVEEMPLINNYQKNNFDAGLIHKLVSSTAYEDNFVNSILALIKTGGYTGLNLDFENIDSKDQTNYIAFLNKLYSAFHKSNLKLSIDIGAMEDAAYVKKLSSFCDYVIVMMYDEHYQAGAPGSIASQSWMDQSLDNLDIPASKMIISLGSFGYDWVSGSTEPANVLSYSDIMDICSTSNLKVNWDKDTGNPYFLYKEQDDNHIVWFLDAATFYNQAKTAYENGAAGIALWRLGSEDQSVWSVLNNINHVSAAITSMSDIKNELGINYTGTGEILYITSQGKNGSRSFNSNKDGYILNENYLAFPSSYTVKRLDKPAGKTVALTFDDGPDSYYTPRILDILEKNNIKATFFIIGENAEINPDILMRIYKDGDDIGNHTFTHPNIAHTSDERTKQELNTTQRLIEEITGHSTILFRPPYAADAEPGTHEEIVPVLRAQSLGYVMVGEAIDPLDWQSPKPEVILSRVEDGLKTGNVVLLHDGGGDRSNTLKVLPKLITELKAQGYSFDTVNQLMSKTRDQVMPPVKSIDNGYLYYDNKFFLAAYDLNRMISLIFYVTIFLGIFRLAFLVYFSLKQKRQGHKETQKGFSPLVSVIIPAYNEEKVIVRTVKSVADSNYKNLEIIVIDDGSKDKTYETVSEAFANAPNVICIKKENGGKPCALNTGISAAKGSIIVAIDADTMLSRDAVSLLVRDFSDPQVAAVSGNVKVGNRKNYLTSWQHCEYVTGFNLERRAYSLLNCITVVPGALGAWRKDLLLQEGLFKDDTLAEDTDMTLSLLRKNYRITFEEKALAYTETPEKLRSILKQRYRWTYGTLQCLWKHKNALFNKKNKTLGFIALPCMWIYQYVFQTLSPLVDICMFYSLLAAGSHIYKLLLSYLLFFLVDVAASCYAFALERESLKPLLWLPIQRIVYRMMMAFVVIKSILSALRGKMVGWNKLERTGHVKTTVK